MHRSEVQELRPDLHALKTSDSAIPCFLEVRKQPNVAEDGKAVHT